MKNINFMVIVTGLAVGIAAVVLTLMGNPANMGFCIACFLRDIAGSMGLHSAAKVQYMRPEIAGILLGAFIMSLSAHEFRAKSGSSPATRFIIGAVIMIGALVFLGCPLRMIIRLGGGDLNALVGFAGFFVGIIIGVQFLKNGFSLKRNYKLEAPEGAILPLFMAGLMVLAIIAPTLFKASEKGPGSMHAGIAAAFVVALIIGALAQRSRLCMAGGLRDILMFKDFNLISGFIAIFAAIIIGNLLLGKFSLGFTGQPVAHNDHIWNFAGMILVGWGSVLIGGCPMRQLILAGEGSGDSAMSVFGMIMGAAIAHNFALAGNAGVVGDGGGVGINGKIAVVVCALILLAISFRNLPKGEVK